MRRNGRNHSSPTTISIRESFRLLKRSQQNHRSFQEIRKVFQQQQKKDVSRKEHERQKRMRICTSNMVGRPLMSQHPPQHAQQVSNQNYHQNLCFNANNGDVNFYKNVQHFNYPLFNFSPNLFAFQGIQPIQRWQPVFASMPKVVPLVQPMHQADVQAVKIQPKQNQNPLPLSKEKQSKPTIPKLEQKKEVLMRNKQFVVYKQVLGTGSYSTVYLGLNLQTNQKVAVKQISEMEQNQFKVLMSIESPYVIKLQSFWRYSGKTYLVLDFCERNFRQEIKTGISQSERLKYFDHIVWGMDALFKKKIIHRDLKFENILISHDKVAKITDFGLSKDMGNMSNVSSRRCGTPYTMAPEIFFNHDSRAYYSQKCDIWSLGVILHEIIYNKHPFNYSSERAARMQRVNVTKTNGHLDILIDRCLVKSPHNRIEWDEFKTIYQSKGRLNIPKQIALAIPVPVPAPVCVVDRSNFKKKVDGKEMKISQQYQAFQPQTSLVIEMQKRAQKQLELERQEKRMNKLKAHNNLITNHIEKVVIPIKNVVQPPAEFKNNNQKCKQQGSSFQIPIKKPMLRMIYNDQDHREKHVRFRQIPAARVSQEDSKWIVPNFKPNKPVEIKQGTIPQKEPLKNSLYTDDHAKDQIVAKFLFLLIFFVLAFNLLSILTR